MINMPYSIPKAIPNTKFICSTLYRMLLVIISVKKRHVRVWEIIHNEYRSFLWFHWFAMTSRSKHSPRFCIQYPSFRLSLFQNLMSASNMTASCECCCQGLGGIKEYLRGSSPVFLATFYNLCTKYFLIYLSFLWLNGLPKGSQLLFRYLLSSLYSRLIVLVVGIYIYISQISLRVLSRLQNTPKTLHMTLNWGEAWGQASPCSAIERSMNDEEISKEYIAESQTHDWPGGPVSRSLHERKDPDALVPFLGSDAHVWLFDPTSSGWTSQS